MLLPTALVRRLLLLGVLLSPIIAAAQSQVALPRSEAARIHQVENSLMPYVPVVGLPGWNLLARMKHHRVPGLSIAVVRNYKIEWVKGYGWADTTARTPVTPATMFSAGSISKMVTGGAAMLLVQRGQLDLDKPINTYLKSWQLAENNFTRKKAVSMRLLLSHQGGTSQLSYFGSIPGKGPLPSVVDILSGQPPAQSRAVGVNRAPGTAFQYSGGGYLVAQLAMMDLTGRDFVSFTDEAIFRPLSMRSATFAQPLPAALQPRASWAYSENSWFKGMPYLYPQQAPAGLYATPTDLAKFIIEVQQAYRGKGKVLTQASARAMLVPQVEVSSGTYREQMGLGPFLLQRADRTTEDSRYFEHTGVNAGFLAYAIGSVTGGNGVVIMMNNDGGAGELGKELRRAVAKVYNWHEFLPEPIQPVRLPVATLDAYAGRYQRGPDEVVTFRREQDYLVETINAGDPILCFPVAIDTIAFTDYALRGTFEHNAAGQVTNFRVLGNDNSMRRLGPTEFLPNELLRLGRISEAVAGYRLLKLNEYQLTYMAYDLLNGRQTNLPAAEGLLQLALEQYPQSAAVHARWGDLYLRRGDTTQAIKAYQTVLRLNPENKDIQEKLLTLTKKPPSTEIR